ncbi:MAG TPA: tRNA pseudouridine(55) synthase TruB [Nitrospiria bacterium]|nr:tRNA pseudouridine(55) synthase TruB [Nitrospiria bacterium]
MIKVPRRSTPAAGAGAPVIARRPPMGFVNALKPSGWTSHDVVAKVRSLLKATLPAPIKVGHVGTLDPAATGVLPLCVGKATKAAQYLVGEQKTYRAVMRLGERTDTQDASGIVLSRSDGAALDGVDRARIEAVCLEFVGPIWQLPPMYSAVKVGGTPLYKAARAGVEVARAPREVVIASLRVLEHDGPLVTVEVDCSKGTYIRTLCHDIGERLGVGAHLARLERLRVGSFTLEEAVTLERIEAAVRSDAIDEIMTPLSRVLAHLPVVIVDDATAARVGHGAPLPHTAADGSAWWREGQCVRIQRNGGDVIAIGRVAAGTAAPQGTPAPGLIRVDAVLMETDVQNVED